MKVSAAEKQNGVPYFHHTNCIGEALRTILETGNFRSFVRREGYHEFAVEGITVKWFYQQRNYSFNAYVDEISVHKLCVYSNGSTDNRSTVVPGAWWSVIAAIPAYLAGLHAVQLQEIKEAQKAKEQSEENERLRVEAEWLKAREK